MKELTLKELTLLDEIREIVGDAADKIVQVLRTIPVNPTILYSDDYIVIVGRAGIDPTLAEKIKTVAAKIGLTPYVKAPEIYYVGVTPAAFILIELSPSEVSLVLAAWRRERQ